MLEPGEFTKLADQIERESAGFRRLLSALPQARTTSCPAGTGLGQEVLLSPGSAGQERPHDIDCARRGQGKSSPYIRMVCTAASLVLGCVALWVVFTGRDPRQFVAAVGCVLGAAAAAGVVVWASLGCEYPAPLVTCRVCGMDFAGYESCPNCTRAAGRRAR